MNEPVCSPGRRAFFRGGATFFGRVQRPTRDSRNHPKTMMRLAWIEGTTWVFCRPSILQTFTIKISHKLPFITTLAVTQSSTVLDS